NEGELILDLAKEEVWVKGELLHSEPRDKLKLMIQAFLKDELDQKSRERAKRNLSLLEEAESLLRT
ncbi:MAG: oxidoreductase, partial [Hydrogenobacter thermophilus]|nr:oxidoreductase [Hydrogenobacter thermophilus]